MSFKLWVLPVDDSGILVVNNLEAMRPDLNRLREQVRPLLHHLEEVIKLDFVFEFN